MQFFWFFYTNKRTGVRGKALQILFYINIYFYFTQLFPAAKSCKKCKYYNFILKDIHKIILYLCKYIIDLIKMQSFCFFGSQKNWGFYPTGTLQGGQSPKLTFFLLFESQELIPIILVLLFTQFNLSGQPPSDVIAQSIKLV